LITTAKPPSQLIQAAGLRPPGKRLPRQRLLWVFTCGLLLAAWPLAPSPDFTFALQPFDHAALSQPGNLSPLGLLLIIIAATLVSEDLTCVSVGALVAQGRVGFVFGAGACFLGIFVGDVLLYLAGRWLGRPALARAPLRWFLRESAVERSSQWFARRGLGVIAASRFVPGARLPTYFVAGTLKTGFWQFTLYFALACLAWTPLLVGLSAWLGGAVVGRVLGGEGHFLLKTFIAGLGLLAVLRLCARAATWRGRRRLVGSWRRLTRWEFWPAWAFYPPVVVYIVWLALKHRHPTLFTAANPAIPAGGFVGESKMAILDGLAGAGKFVARAELIPAATDSAARVAQARRFMRARGYDFPVVLKPDVGERGAGVAIVRSQDQLAAFFGGCAGDAIIQEYVPGLEFGVFYYRYPGEGRGRIFAITEKRFPEVVGDGRGTLERLILNDRRAVAMARFYCAAQQARLDDVPPAGERVRLVELGTHCRGAIFLDGGWAKTAALEAAIDRISRSYEGFYFGRYDIRAASGEDLTAGRNFKVIELNGVTSEATSIYDPRHSVFAAWRVLCEQWRIAYEIGAENRRRGVAPGGLGDLLRLLAQARRG
jgi:membrane protein DedA with SNARE-associated domain